MSAPEDHFDVEIKDGRKHRSQWISEMKKENAALRSQLRTIGMSLLIMADSKDEAVVEKISECFTVKYQIIFEKEKP